MNTIQVSFKGQPITVNGTTPVMFPEDAEYAGSCILAKAESWDGPYTSLEHLLGHASGWGMQQGKISQSVHFRNCVSSSSEKISFSDIALYISKEEYDRLKEIVDAQPYTMNEWTMDAQKYIMSRYAVEVPITLLWTSERFKEVHEECNLKGFENGFYTLESCLCKLLEIDPNDFLKALYNITTDTAKAFWKNFYKTADKKGCRVISPRK
jgi:hypothetical protein